MHSAKNMLCIFVYGFSQYLTHFSVNCSNIFFAEIDILHALFFVHSSTVASEEYKVYAYECAIFKKKSVIFL